MKKLIYLVGLIVVLLLAGFYAYRSVSLPKYNDNTQNMNHIDDTKIINSLVTHEPGIYYFGFENCPWCKELLPILDNQLAENNAKAYTVDTKSKEFSNEDKQKVEDFFKKYTGENELTVPFTVFINSKKEVRYNIGTVSGHNAPEKRLTDKQKKQLIEILDESIEFAEK